MDKKSRKVWNVIFYHANAFLFAAGIVVIAFTTELLSVLHYIIGSVLLAYSVFIFIYTYCVYRNTKTFAGNIASSVITALAGLVILLTTENSMLLIGVGWGLFGLYRGGRELADTFSKIQKHEDFLLNLFQAAVTIALAALLLYDPLHHIEFHMNILGLEIIVSSMKAYKAKSAVVEKIPLENIREPRPSASGDDLIYPYKNTDGGRQ